MNFIKFGLRMYSGDLPLDNLAQAMRLGATACAGVVFSRLLLARLSAKTFQFLYTYVTFVIVSLTGSLLIAGWDLKSLIRFLVNAMV